MSEPAANWLARRISNWRQRHRNATSFHLHMLGIPACFVAAPAMLLLRQWALAGLLFVAGYALQFLGHLVEGNRSGEEALLRRLLGKGGKPG
jgi:uncharacterized membrane protein YGL010W